MNAQHPKHPSMTAGIIDESRYDEWRSLPAMFFDQAERLADRPLLISKQRRRLAGSKLERGRQPRSARRRPA